MLICEGGSAFLSCGVGYITVVEANYGRTDSVTCTSGRPANQISNTHCFQESSLSTMTTRCNGRNSCLVSAANSVFPDPCTGTYKYLNLTYDCLPARRSATCENTQSVIVCATGVIFVDHANYGRRDLVTRPNKLATTPHCYSPQTRSMCSRCDGRKSCQLHASSSLYTDPCRGVHKYLEVTFNCA
ncbi:L-rhamnose-binding lectin CSL3 [Labeo rohita]|uniref:L-rhamnose-binding lectin CSL3 n=1 Tax=Labeo rohita TaxID=84645 RepID=UPI0021E2A208|nr:L-rhamnose-binding lectin CSL3 [Labeo rohita]XP_050953160.1 L-rhamnose-binding lectin CSL3 [Labeo rohita]XP_050953161.1 L-rhamnose-binding lectin CSL3 [Labeo rohita]XP_050953162.1 L-rhamnose-binding lectin CSL3 [Labeo rohita]